MAVTIPSVNDLHGRTTCIRPHRLIELRRDRARSGCTRTAVAATLNWPCDVLERAIVTIIDVFQRAFFPERRHPRGRGRYRAEIKTIRRDRNIKTHEAA